MSPLIPKITDRFMVSIEPVTVLSHLIIATILDESLSFKTACVSQQKSEEGAIFLRRGRFSPEDTEGKNCGHTQIQTTCCVPEMKCLKERNQSADQ